MTRVKGPFGKFFLVVVLLIATDLSSKTIHGFSIGAEKETIQMDKRSHHGLARIVGGQVVKYGEESTWTVRIRDRNGFAGILCAGALLTNSHVVTTAQCVDPYKTRPYELVVRAGDWSKSTDAGEVVTAVKNVVIHPGYYHDDDYIQNNDVAVLELVKPVEWDKYKRWVALPTKDIEWTHQETLFTVSGWGLRTEDEDEDLALTETLKLHRAYVPFVDCGYGDVIKHGMLCAGDLEKGGVDACIGDTGAPLVTFYPNFFGNDPLDAFLRSRNTTDIIQTLTDIERDEKYERLTPPHPKTNYFSKEDYIREGGIPILAGVSSWGKGCGRAEYPGVYTDMRKYREWIYRQTGGEPIWIITP